ncbi:MAG: autotransporter assembly complex family protein [Devosiaceae bacterium]
MSNWWPCHLHRRARLNRALLAAGLALACLYAVPANALNLFGVQLFGEAEDARADDVVIGTPVPYVAEVTISATQSDDFDEEAVRNASSLWRGRDDPAAGMPGLLASARSDYRRMLGALYVQGHYGGVINIRLNGREAADLPADSELATPVSVSITVDPGPLYRFGQVTIANQAPFTNDPRDFVTPPSELGLLAGEPARSGLVLQAETLTVDAWRQQGHALAQIADRNVSADHPSHTVDVDIIVQPGPPATYGPLLVEGADRMDPAFIAYMADLPEGEAYDPDDVDEATARLAALEVFRSIRIEEAASLSASGELEQTIFVQERPLRRIGAGASFSTIDGAGLEAYWLHRNLFGRAERLRLEGRISGANSFDPEEFTYRFGATFTRPGFITPDTNLFAALAAQREVLEAYTRTGVSGEVGLEHPFSPELTGRFSINGRYAQFDDQVFGERDFTSAGFQARLTYDTRDLPADASSGLYLDASVEPFYEFSRGNVGAATTAEARAYVGLGNDDRIVLAGRLRAGTLVGPSIAETAPDRLFLSGGGGSVRGYAYRNIGVERPGGLVTGGRFLLEGSAELRARITDVIGAVAFADFGYVDADPVPSFDAFNADMRVGVGAGVRYLTPLGPIRLDVAVPLDKRAGDPDFAIYLGIGQAF